MVEQLLSKLLKQLDDFYEDKFDFVDEESNVRMDDDDVEICLERILENEGMENIIGTEKFEDLLEYVWENYRSELLEKLNEIEEDIQEIVEDHKLCSKLGHRAYYHYIYGLSEKDFI